MFLLDAFSNEAKALGQEFSWTKNKFQNFRGLLELVQLIYACGKDIAVREFCIP